MHQAFIITAHSARSTQRWSSSRAAKEGLLTQIWTPAVVRTEFLGPHEPLSKLGCVDLLNADVCNITGRIEIDFNLSPSGAHP
jgi:hypothetical protein